MTQRLPLPVVYNDCSGRLTDRLEGDAVAEIEVCAK